MKNLHQLTGLAGVDQDETADARKWAKRFERPILIVALWIPVQWYLEAKGVLPRWASFLGDWVIWSVFVLETSVLTWLVKDKRAFLTKNWMNLLIIIAGLPVLWSDTPLIGVLRNLRLFVLIGLLLRVSRTVKEVLALNRLGGTLWFAVLVVISSGVIMSSIDPAIKTPWEGIWWAWVTITTVGYGDLVPSTHAGKLFAAFLMLIGVGLFSILTANLSAFFIGKSSRKEEIEVRYRLKDVQEKLNELEKKAVEQEEKLDAILKALKNPKL